MASIAGSSVASPSPSSLPPLSFDLLLFLRSSHFSHGLRHLDYERYRRYCATRIRRLRSILKVTHNAKTFKYHEFSASDILDARPLTLLALDAERCWAYAMQLKGEVTKENGRPKFHMISKLARAVTHAKSLTSLCAVRCDARSQLQCEAYFNWLLGSLFFEKEAHGQALNHFNHSARVYKELAALGSSELSGICDERLSDLHDHMRLCEYFKRGRGEDKEEKELMDLTEEIINDQLNEKLNSLKAEAIRHQALTLNSIDWCGSSIPLMSQKMREKITEERQIIERIHKQPQQQVEMKDTDEVGETSLVSLCGRLLSVYDEAGRVLFNELNEVKLDTHKQQLTQLQNYINARKLDTLALRNTGLARQIQQRLASEGASKSRKVLKSLEELMTLHEKSAAAMGELLDLANASKNPSLVDSSQARLALFNAARHYFLSDAHRRLGRFGDAATLLDAIQAEINKTLKGKFQGNKQMFQQEDIELFNFLERQVSFALTVLGSEALVYSADLTNEVAGKLKDVSVDGKSNKATKSAANNAASARMLDDFSSFLDGSALPAPFSFPPAPLPAPSKPILFDLAFNHMEMPQFTDIVKKTAPAAASPAKPAAAAAAAAPKAKSPEQKSSTASSSSPSAPAAAGGFFGRLWGAK